jgi:hypothetical protein
LSDQFFFIITSADFVGFSAEEAVTFWFGNQTFFFELSDRLIFSAAFR